MKTAFVVLTYNRPDAALAVLRSPAPDAQAFDMPRRNRRFTRSGYQPECAMYWPQ